MDELALAAEAQDRWAIDTRNEPIAFYLDRAPPRSDRFCRATVFGPTPGSNLRHFLFYFRDDEFECDAAEWELVLARRERRN